MSSTPIDLILRQSYLHLTSYGLVLSILFVALADAFLIRHLRKALRRERAELRSSRLQPEDGMTMIHPIARGLGMIRNLRPAWNQVLSPDQLRRAMDLKEAALFVPLRTRMTLTRDLSTLMGLIATLLALVAAAADFARNGRPELLVGSVGTGCVATCVAAIGCALALWNLSKLTRLRLEVACDVEEELLRWSEQPDWTEPGAVPILHQQEHDLNSPPEHSYAPLR